MGFATLMMRFSARRHHRKGTTMLKRRRLTTLNVSAVGLKNIEDAIFINQIRKPTTRVADCAQNWWHLNFFWELQGIMRTSRRQQAGLILSGKISGFDHPTVNQFRLMREQISGGTVNKHTLPDPTFCLVELKRPVNAVALEKIYASDTEMVHDLAAAYHQIMLDLYQAGARHIQLDSCPTAGKQSAIVMALGAQVNDEAVRDLPVDLCVQRHVTYGGCYSA